MNAMHFYLNITFFNISLKCDLIVWKKQKINKNKNFIGKCYSKNGKKTKLNIHLTFLDNWCIVEKSIKFVDDTVKKPI